MWRRRKPEPASDSLRDVVQSQGMAIVDLDHKLKTLRRSFDELEDHVDKRFKSIRAMAGAAASRAGSEVVDGGPPQPEVPPSPPPDPRVSPSKTDLIAQLAASAARPR